MKFFFAIFLLFGVFLSGGKAFALAPDLPLELPNAVPYNDGTTIWNNWLMFWAQGIGKWTLIYHNSNLSIIDDDTNAFVVASPSLPVDHAVFTGEQGALAGDWISGTGNWFPFIVDANLGTYNPDFCSESFYASETVFASAFFEKEFPLCTDIYPLKAGYPVFLKVNLQSDSQTIGTITSPEPEQIINSATDDFVDVPSIIDNPTGFVSSIFVNMGIWVRNLIVPSDDFFSSRFGAVEAVAEEHFPILFSIASIADGSIAVDSSITIGSLDFGGSSSAPLSFFAPGTWNPDTFAGLRSFLSMLMYVWLAYFVVVKLSRIFSS